MELDFKEYKYKEKKLSFTIKEKEINGITGNHLEEFIEIIRLNTPSKTNIRENRKEIKEEDFYKTKKKIAFVREKSLPTRYRNLKEEMIDYMKEEEIYPKNLSKKLKDSLKIVGLEESLLDRNHSTLSSSEDKLVQIAKELLLNPEMIILEEPLRVLDMKNRKKLMA